MANMQNVLNAIRSECSAQYQNRIPVATRENMDEIRFAMISDDNIQIANEFMGTLLNKLVKSVVLTKRFTNPLKPLKKGKKPLGDTIEEIYTNFVKASAKVRDDGTTATSELLSRNLPDTKTVYHRMNYEAKYKITVNRTDLTKAFMSYEALESYVSSLITTLYNSAELDEFINMKAMISHAWNNGAIKKITINEPDNEVAGKEFIKAVKNISGLMRYPSENYNGYLNVQTTDTKPITTFSRADEQILIIDVPTNTNVSIDVLASVFNMSVAEFNDTRKIVIDSFPNANTVRAVLVDEQFFQIWDDYFVIKSFENPGCLYTNYWLHVGQTMAYSPLVNAVGFYVEPTATTEE